MESSCLAIFKMIIIGYLYVAQLEQIGVGVNWPPLNGHVRAVRSGAAGAARASPLFME